MPEQEKGGIIREIITHINALEEKMGLLKESMSELEDLDTVNRLDIINLKNEVEKIKMSSPELPEETMANLRELEGLSERIGSAEKWDFLEKGIAEIISMKGRLDSSGIGDISNALKSLQKRIERLESGMSGLTESDHGKSINMLEKRMETVEKKTDKINHCPSCGALVKDGAMFCTRCGKKV